MCSYFWEHADLLEHAVSGTLPKELLETKTTLVACLEEKVPLTSFEFQQLVYDFDLGN